MSVFSVDLDRLRRRTSIKWSRFEPDVLPMFVAEMDVDPAPAITERLQGLIADGDFGYPEQPVYQHAWADFADWMWGWELDPEADLQLAGDVMSGMRELVLAVTEPGDAVVINPPIYPPFRAVCRDTGRRLVEVPMTPAGRLDLDALAAAFEAGAKAMLLCSPHNPNGTVHTREELTALAALAAQHNVTVISDEIHAPLAGAAHIPFTTLPGAERSFVVTSASKSWNLAGLKAALIVAGPQARPAMAALPGHVAESASHVAIEAHSAALTGARDWLRSATAEIALNKLHLRSELERLLPQVSYEPSEGTYLAWLDCSALGLEHPGRHFHDVGRVRFNFGTDFDAAAKQFVRMNVATSPALITEGVQRMAASL
ncbi:aminotransferase class I/II-fold pyridoxal phosphate-dependent enzyme [Tessaracoccus sp. OS52]|uniref:MalY/PatB family protein n=1 Tax=Tessaracoccus sp. OS52 TaxID=2886691 RepID=UPI001D10C275|nr:aminotransferase class I/II-fold pyridoxal phosphate-dependent enzyme [Tessaracoccus sp. OS52]MCC2594491.1 aminotransferase class I/II-fold pyridoxal phosphate-dependent enzyme [Tessaracoccus sp. OS52]